MSKLSTIILLVLLPFGLQAQKRSSIIVDTSDYMVHPDVIKDNFGRKEIGVSEIERMLIIKLVQVEVDRYNELNRWQYNKDMSNARNPQYVPYICQPLAGGNKRYLIRESTRESIMNSVQNVTPLKDRIIEFNNYQRQYIVKHNEKGEKIVTAYFYCTDHGREIFRRDTVIIVRDGGKCYFHIEVNMITQKIIGFYVNGEA